MIVSRETLEAADRELEDQEKNFVNSLRHSRSVRVLPGSISRGELFTNEGSVSSAIDVGLGCDVVLTGPIVEIRAVREKIQAALAGEEQEFSCFDCQGPISEANLLANPRRSVCDGCRERRRIERAPGLKKAKVPA